MGGGWVGGMWLIKINTQSLCIIAATVKRSISLYLIYIFSKIQQGRIEI